MATVHYGRLMGPVGFARTVAIKRLHAQFAKDPEFVSMFLDEARLAARIRHPNVVPTLDVVALEGELFLVMEYVQGETLARLLRLSNDRKEHLPPSHVASIMVAVLHGLHAAHEAKTEHGEPLGIVHRDVSPQNVLVGTDGVTRVLDFGVAKAAGRIQSTHDGQLKGKLPYMPPEQIRGTVSRLTDVYASSVVLWEALTCKRLFSGENEAVIYSKVHEMEVQPPSHYAPGITPDVDALVLRGLHRDPTKRFQSAREMARALEGCLPIVASSQIGEWVEAMAETSLAERSARVARIESNSAHLQAPVERSSVQSIVDELQKSPPTDRASRDDVSNFSAPEVTVRGALTATIVTAAPPMPETLSGPEKSSGPNLDEQMPTLSNSSVSQARGSAPTGLRTRKLSPVLVGGGAILLLASAALLGSRVLRPDEATHVETKPAAPADSSVRSQPEIDLDGTAPSPAPTLSAPAVSSAPRLPPVVHPTARPEATRHTTTNAGGRPSTIPELLKPKELKGVLDGQK
jgi:serine/threonine protein kinase